MKPDKARLASQRSGGTAAAVSPAADEVAAQGSKAAAGAGSNKNKKQRNRRAKNKQESVAPAPKQRQEVPDE